MENSFVDDLFLLRVVALIGGRALSGHILGEETGRHPPRCHRHNTVSNPIRKVLAERAAVSNLVRHAR